MGTSTNAYLAYGYDLGGDDGWKVAEIGEWGELQLPWLSAGEDGGSEDEDEDSDFPTEAMLRLAREAGHDVEFDFQAEDKIGLRFESHCSGSSPMWLLAAKVVTAHRGYPETIDFAALERERAERRWDERLIDACRVLGITPTQGTPSWVLCSYWSS
ncbi:hypothetical protein [Micromonospora sp. NPDC005652]|uniref:hypothetical protein n=1 Tax=Micromonospora sp. NPDC005652 TaxID=3157046 RepID=UPI00340CC2A4